MGPIEPAAADALPVTPLAPDDLADCLALSTEAGWNQLAADWQLMLAAGAGFGIRRGGRVVATSIALPFAPATGWISMVLVTARQRRRGFGTGVLKAAIAWLGARRLSPFLDATPAGEGVYAPLGFRGLDRLARWRGAAGAGAPDPAVREIAAADLAGILAADAAAFGADRAAVLRDLVARDGFRGWIERSGGFLLSRRGRTATQLGPLVAADPTAARALLATALASLDGPVLADVFDREADLAALLAGHGLAVERRFARMALGPAARPASPTLRLAAGPELG